MTVPAPTPRQSFGERWQSRLATEGWFGFQEIWNAPGERVDAPNQRGKGSSEVLRVRTKTHTPGLELFVKRQTNWRVRNELWFTSPLACEAEARHLRSLRRQGFWVPEVVFVGAVKTPDGNTLGLLVTASLGPVTPLDGPALHGDLTLRRRVIRAVAQEVRNLHRHRWRHGALYPKHILVGLPVAEPPRVGFLDFERARRWWWYPGRTQRDLGSLLRRWTASRADHLRFLMAYWGEPRPGRKIRRWWRRLRQR